METKFTGIAASSIKLAFDIHAGTSEAPVLLNSVEKVIENSFYSMIHFNTGNNSRKYVEYLKGEGARYPELVKGELDGELHETAAVFLEAMHKYWEQFIVFASKTVDPELYTELTQ